MTEQWQPVEDYFRHSRLESWQEDGEWWIAVENRGQFLPDDLRLCRRVKSSAFDRIRVEMEEARAVPATEKFAAGLLRALEILQESETT